MIHFPTKRRKLVFKTIALVLALFVIIIACLTPVILNKASNTKINNNSNINVEAQYRDQNSVSDYLTSSKMLNALINTYKDLPTLNNQFSKFTPRKCKELIQSALTDPLAKVNAKTLLEKNIMYALKPFFDSVFTYTSVLKYCLEYTIELQLYDNKVYKNRLKVTLNHILSEETLGVFIHNLVLLEHHLNAHSNDNEVEEEQDTKNFLIVKNEEIKLYNEFVRVCINLYRKKAEKLLHLYKDIENIKDFNAQQILELLIAFKNGVSIIPAFVLLDITALFFNIEVEESKNSIGVELVPKMDRTNSFNYEKLDEISVVFIPFIIRIIPIIEEMKDKAKGEEILRNVFTNKDFYLFMENIIFLFRRGAHVMWLGIKNFD
eukprot:GAHX01003136.1.p1 GENE.GAHX01003136.1~~GAHX01003136.1.p1  ORF type:complete len:377 (-),score=73.88 GAHX01003136.1:34-1164(-)